LSSGAEPEASFATLVRDRGATLLDALERHVPGSREHADGTASYAFAAAAELGASRLRAELVREAARLHEIGMVYLPAEVLARPRTELGPQEAVLADSHPAYGAQLARGAAIPEQACEWIGAAGARLGGVLPGEEVPLEARMIRVACACDSLLAKPKSTRQPGARLAIAELRAAAGGDLDPRVVEAVVAILDRAASATP
jgi:HD-GYP domain-containing protein (c-di-GMP phosphodiesterase class II)